MLKLTLTEFFLRNVPEMMIFIWGIYIISRQQIKIKNYIFASVILALSTFYVRELPIHYGVHTIVNNVVTICIVIIIGIPIIKAIYSTLLMTLMLAIAEIINMFILKIFSVDIEKLLNNVIMKCTLGLPSLVLLALFIFLTSLFLKKREGIKSVSN